MEIGEVRAGAVFAIQNTATAEAGHLEGGGLNQELNEGLAKPFCGFLRLKFQEFFVYHGFSVILDHSTTCPLFFILDQNLVDTRKNES